jgi:hypothetical protein
MGDLTTLATALDWLGQSSDDDDIVARLVSAVSTSIQAYLGFQVASATYARSFNGRGGRQMMLPDRPVTAVASVTIDDQVVPSSTGAFVDGFVFDDKFIYLRGCYEFCRGVQNVQVGYTAGFASTPLDIEQACLEWLKIIYEGLDVTPGTQEISAGDTKITYSDAITKLASGSILVPPVIAAKLQPYRRVAPT